MNIKNIVRETLIFLHIDLTKNLKYDRLTKAIMKKCIKSNDNCIDIGCHKGEILDLMLKYAPHGKHLAFEPIPYLYHNLKDKYENKALVFPFALSNEEGQATFQFVKNAPAYSGLRRRRYDISNPEIEEITVEKQTLDNIVSTENEINFIKIDVEGGEFDVLKGSKRVLLDSKRIIIIFECGKGGTDYYGVTPNDIYSFLTKEIGLNLYTLSSFLKDEQSISEEDFKQYFQTNKEYYFIANK